MKTRNAAPTTWRNRIIGHGDEDPAQLLANPKNWRIHPKAQQDALAGVLDEVGWIQDVIVNQQTGYVVDGHLRVALAISKGEPTVPVKYVDLTPEEEALVLTTLDPIAGMAAADKEQLEALLREVATGNEGLKALLEQMAEGVGIFAIGEAGMPALADGDRAGFQEMTFTLTDEQAATVGQALKAAKANVNGNTGNQNSNGNALALLAEGYLGQG